jgi:hypothetical protein
VLPNMRMKPAAVNKWALVGRNCAAAYTHSVDRPDAPYNNEDGNGPTVDDEYTRQSIPSEDIFDSRSFRSLRRRQVVRCA